jgi:hypothetical protein
MKKESKFAIELVMDMELSVEAFPETVREYI